MFDFEKLVVYEKSQQLTIEILSFLKSNKIRDGVLIDQIKRAALSVTLNIAEGCGRASKADKKRFYIIARSSAFELVALLQILESLEHLSLPSYRQYYAKLEEISKMLLSLTRKSVSLNP